MLVRMCYDFEIPERIKQKSRLISEKEEQENEVLEPIKVTN
jgi:hypothetical protein